MALLARFKLTSLHTKPLCSRSLQSNAGWKSIAIFSSLESTSTLFKTYIFSPCIQGTNNGFRSYAKAAIKLKKKKAKKRELKRLKDEAALGTPSDKIVIKKQREVKVRPKQPHIHRDLSVDQLYKALTDHIALHGEARVSWLEIMLNKVKTLGELNRAVKMHRVYQMKGIITSPVTDTSLIKAACRVRNPADIVRMLQDVEKYRIWPTLQGMNHLLHFFAIVKNTYFAEATFNIIRLRNLLPDSESYFLMMRLYLNLQDFDKAHEWLQKAKDDQQPISPGIYNNFLRAYKIANKYDEALQCREEMKKDGVGANLTTSALMCIIHMGRGSVEDAVNVFKEVARDHNPAELVKHLVVQRPLTQQDIDHLKVLVEAVQNAQVELPENAAESIAKIKLQE